MDGATSLRLWKSCQDMTPGVQVRKRAGLLQHADDRGPGVGQRVVVDVRVQPLAGLARAVPGLVTQGEHGLLAADRRGRRQNHVSWR